jgi:hypothetical protein
MALARVTVGPLGENPIARAGDRLGGLPSREDDAVDGGSAYWRDSSRAKATVNALNPSAYADLGRAPTFSDTLVEVAISHAAAAE